MKTPTTTAILVLIVAASCFGADIPPELATIKTRHEAAVAVATKPLRERYILELQQLKNRAMLSKNLDLANAVDTELKGISTAIPDVTQNRAEKVRAELAGSQWTVVPNKQPIVVTFEEHGVLQQNPGPNAGFPETWTVNEDGDLLLAGRKVTTKDKFKTFTVSFGHLLTFVRKKH